MSHGEEEDTAFHMAAANRIEEGAGGQTRFAASYFPRRLLDACRIHQMIVGLPPQDKTRLEAAKGSQPWTATRASIKSMDEGASPALRDHSQELTVFILLVTGQGATRRPPAQSSQHGRPLLIRSASQEQTNPMQPWDKDGLAGG